MLEYLYNLLQDVDRCDATSNELLSYIKHNREIIKNLKNDMNGGTRKDYIDDYLRDVNDSFIQTDIVLRRSKRTLDNLDINKVDKVLETAVILAKYLKVLTDMFANEKPEYAELEAQFREIKNILSGIVDSN
jgi:Mg2+ and Co2+ transporter CorA